MRSQQKNSHYLIKTEVTLSMVMLTLKTKGNSILSTTSIGKKENQWDIYLPQLAGAVRSSVNRHTGYTPNKLMLGREVNTPADIMFPSRNSGPDEGTDKYVKDLVQNMKEAHETARRTLKTSQKRMKTKYDLRVLQRSFQEGGVVYLLDTASVKGKCRKLLPPWKGPAIITKKVTSALFRVKLRNALFSVKHDRIKPCRDRTLPNWIVNFKLQSDTDEDLEDSKIYCFCKKPWNNQFMIQCDFCQEWYHGKCVDVTPTEALNIDKYKCRACR